MNEGPVPGKSDVQSLRRAFDASFAAAATEASERHQDLLAIGVADQQMAIRLGEITRVEALRKRVPVPGGRSELMGLVGSQDRLYALFSLAALLGQSSSEEPRWLMLAAGDEPVALAFHRFDGLIRVGQGALSRPSNVEGGRPLVPHLVRVAGDVRGVLDVTAVLDQVRQRESALRGRK